jgi:hypothetical protein
MRTKDEILDETRRSCDHYMRHMGLGAYALAPIFVEILCDIRDVLNGEYKESEYDRIPLMKDD